MQSVSDKVMTALKSSDDPLKQIEALEKVGEELAYSIWGACSSGSGACQIFKGEGNARNTHMESGSTADE